MFACMRACMPACVGLRSFHHVSCFGNIRVCLPVIVTQLLHCTVYCIVLLLIFLFSRVYVWDVYKCLGSQNSLAKNYIFEWYDMVFPLFFHFCCSGCIGEPNEVCLSAVAPIPGSLAIPYLYYSGRGGDLLPWLFFWITQPVASRHIVLIPCFIISGVLVVFLSWELQWAPRCPNMLNTKQIGVTSYKIKYHTSFKFWFGHTLCKFHSYFWRVCGKCLLSQNFKVSMKNIKREAGSVFLPTQPIWTTQQNASESKFVMFRLCHLSAPPKWRLRFDVSLDSGLDIKVAKDSPRIFPEVLPAPHVAGPA